jgi:hypothetical protein
MMGNLDKAIEYYKTANHKRIHLAGGDVINIESLLIDIRDRLEEQKATITALRSRP